MKNNKNQIITFTNMCRVLTVTFLFLKIVGLIRISWFMVFLPVIVDGIIYAMCFLATILILKQGKRGK